MIQTDGIHKTQEGLTDVWGRPYDVYLRICFGELCTKARTILPSGKTNRVRETSWQERTSRSTYILVHVGERTFTIELLAPAATLNILSSPRTLA